MSLTEVEAAAVVQGHAPSILAAVAEASVDLAIFRRTLPEALMAALAGAGAARMPQLRAVLAAGEVGAAVEVACETAGTPPACAEAPAEDAAALAATFAETLGCVQLMVRLKASADQTCRKWHRDAVVARLLCTYIGAGTQFGTPGATGASPCSGQLAAGDVGLFKGGLWPGGVPRLLHRSPPTASLGWRLLLAIDPAS